MYRFLDRHCCITLIILAGERHFQFSNSRTPPGHSPSKRTAAATKETTLRAATRTQTARKRMPRRHTGNVSFFFKELGGISRKSTKIKEILHISSSSG